MQDKRIDEQFINHAWEQMLSTLDREMPAEKKDRRVVMVPWRWAAAASVLLLLTIGAGWWLSLQNSQGNLANSTAAVATTQSAHSASNEDCETATTNETNATLAAAQPSQQALDKKEYAPIVTNKTAPKKAFDNQYITKNSSPVANNIKSQTPSFGNENKEIVTGIATIETATTTPQNQQATAEQSALPTLSALDLEKLKTEPVALSKKKQVPLWSPVLEEKKSDSKWNIGVELATYASPNAAVDGYAGGAIVEVPIESKKFNLRTGLNFNSQQRYFDSNIPAEEASRGSSPTFGTAVVVDPDPHFQVNAQQLSFPVTMEFKPGKSWGLEGGLQASYLLGARNLKGAEAYQTIAGFTNGNEDIRNFVSSLSNKQYDMTTNAEPNVDNSTVNIDAFRRFDVGLTLGLGVYPSKNLGVRLQYQRGLIDMLKANQFTAYGNNVRLSAVYFFGK